MVSLFHGAVDKWKSYDSKSREKKQSLMSLNTQAITLLQHE